jgi:hypothetical protein
MWFVFKGIAGYQVGLPEERRASGMFQRRVAVRAGSGMASEEEVGDHTTWVSQLGMGGEGCNNGLLVRSCIATCRVAVDLGRAELPVWRTIRRPGTAPRGSSRIRRRRRVAGPYRDPGL